MLLSDRPARNYPSHVGIWPAPMRLVARIMKQGIEYFGVVDNDHCAIGGVAGAVSQEAACSVQLGCLTYGLLIE